MPETGKRRPRSDAALSREAILAAARALFTSEGPRVPLDRIAERAHVGSATLFRHFPNRAHLLRAAMASVNAALARDAEREAATTTDAEALWRWLERMLRQCAAERTIVEAVNDVGNSGEDGWAGLVEAGLPLLQRARAGGLVDDTVSMIDILRLLNAVAAAAGGDPDDATRLFRIVRRGISGETAAARSNGTT